MQYEPGKSFAWYQAYGRGYLAVFAYPGNRRTRVLCKDRKPIVFDRFVDAIEAAQLQVRKVCEPDIRAEAAPEAPMPSFLDSSAWKTERSERQAIERREAFRGLGKGFVTVETKRRRAVTR